VVFSQDEGVEDSGLRIIAEWIEQICTKMRVEVEGLTVRRPVDNRQTHSSPTFVLLTCVGTCCAGAVA
jgi:hypothetical protein